jgi:tetratricopeptide (TPR) repeat protein
MRKAFIAAIFTVCLVLTRAAAQEITDAQPWDPLKANKDIEVGTYYLKRGNYDAAIDRFEEAARLHPGLALPYLKLGQTYEKKKDWQSAIESYRKYLDVDNTAPDGKDIRKRIRTLEQRLAAETSKSARPGG